MRFPEKLRMLADARGWSMAELARRTGLRPSTVASWTTTKARPTLPDARLLSLALGVSLDYLADDGQDQPPVPDEDASTILTVIRDLHLERAEAIRRLTTPAPTPGVFRPLGTVELPKGSSRSTHETKR
jgi:transcriptional regulator with XRE-family HTH domain